MFTIKYIVKQIYYALHRQNVIEIVKLNSGLTRQEIAQHNKGLSCIFTDEIYEIYQYYNGLLKEFNYLSSCEGSFNFLSLSDAIDSSRKIYLVDYQVYLLLLPLFTLYHEGGAEYFAILLGGEDNPILHFNDENYPKQYTEYFTKKFIAQNTVEESWEDLLLDEEFDDDGLGKKNTIINNVKETRKSYRCINQYIIYDSLKDILLLFKDICEEAEIHIMQDYHNCLFIDRNKLTWIHYRYRSLQSHQEFSDNKKFKLTLEEEGLIEQIKIKWFRYTNTKINKSKAAQVIKNLYHYFNKPEPKILFSTNLYTANLCKNNPHKIQDEFTCINKFDLEAFIDYGIQDWILAPLEYALYNPKLESKILTLKSDLQNQLNNEIENDLLYELKDFFWYRSIYKNSKYSLENNNYFSVDYNLIFLAALLDYARNIEINFNQKKLNLFLSFCQQIELAIPFSDFIIIFDKPYYLRLQ